MVVQLSEFPTLPSRHEPKFHAEASTAPRWTNFFFPSTIEKVLSPSAHPFYFHTMTGDRKRTANAMNPALDPCVFWGFQGVAADAASNIHRDMHFAFGRPVLPRAAVGCNCAKNARHALLIAKDTPSRIGSNARCLFGRQRASQAAPARGHVAARAPADAERAGCPHGAFFSLCRPPHRCVFLDKGQTSAERKKLEHTSQHAIAAARRTRLPRARVCVRAYVRSQPERTATNRQQGLPTPDR